MKALVTRSSHHGSLRTSSTQASEMFQSSLSSWSSKIIADGTVASSQRMSGSDHDSRNSCVYSSKSAMASPGGSAVSRRASMNAAVSGGTSSAYTWSPSSSNPSGHAASPDCSRRE